MKFNVNNKVRVKITDFGLAKLREDHDRLNAETNGALGSFIPPKTDGGGWSDMQLWCLMRDLGPHVTLSGPVPFETEIELVLP